MDLAKNEKEASRRLIIKSYDPHTLLGYSLSQAVYCDYCAVAPDFEAVRIL